MWPSDDIAVRSQAEIETTHDVIANYAYILPGRRERR
jgi:hypothetical protein